MMKYRFAGRKQHGFVRKEKAPLVQRHFCKGFFIGSILRKMFLSSRRHRRRVIRSLSRRVPSRRLSSHMRRIFSGGILFHMRIFFLRGFLHMRGILPGRSFFHMRRILRPGTGSESLERLLRRPVIGCIRGGTDGSGAGKDKSSQRCSDDDVLFHDGYSFHPLGGNMISGTADRTVRKEYGEN